MPESLQEPERRKEITHPASRQPIHVEKDEHKGRPESAKHGKKPDNETENQRRRNQVAERLHPEEPGKGIPLHGLKDVVLCHVKHLGVVPPKLLNRRRHVLRDTAGKDDFAFGPREQEGVKDLLGRRADVLARDGAPGRIRVGRWVSWRAKVPAGAAGPSPGALVRRVVRLLFLAEESGHLGVLVLLLFRRVHGRTRGSMVHVAHVVQDGGGVLRAGLVEIGSLD